MWFILLLLVLIVVLWAFWHSYQQHEHFMMKYGALIRNYCHFEHGDASNNLFIKYGGLQTIQAVVDTSVTNLLKEESLADVFAVVGTENHRTGNALKACLDLFFTELFGGPVTYPGKTFTRGMIVNARSMKASHASLTITLEQFNKFNEVIAQTLVDSGVSQADVNSVAPKLNEYLCDIVTVK